MKATSLISSLLALSFAFLASASSSGQTQITAAQLLKIAPNSKTCDNPPAPGECATAEQAAPAISASFGTYHVTSPAEQAAVISLMAFESDDFKYNKNHSPGRSGQGSKYPVVTTCARPYRDFIIRANCLVSTQHANAVLQPQIRRVNPRTGW